MQDLGKSKEVQSFISELQELSPIKAEIVIALYKIFLEQNHNFLDKFIYGGIGVYLKGDLIGGIWVSKHHVSLVFSEGYELEDPYGVLEGKGKFRRHIKIREFSDIASKNCKEFVEKLFSQYIK